MSEASDAKTVRSPALSASYLDLFDRTQDCVLILEASTHAILDLNRGALLLLGPLKEKLIGRSVLSWLDPASRHDFQHALRVSVRRSDWPHFDVVWKISESRRLTMEVSASIIKLQEAPYREREAIQLIARDVSFRRQSEQLIQTLQNKLALTQASPEIIEKAVIPFKRAQR